MSHLPHVQLCLYKIHTPGFAGVFSDFLSICVPHYIAQFLCVRQQEVVESTQAEHTLFDIPPRTGQCLLKFWVVFYKNVVNG